MARRNRVFSGVFVCVLIACSVAAVLAPAAGEGVALDSGVAPDIGEDAGPGTYVEVDPPVSPPLEGYVPAVPAGDSAGLSVTRSNALAARERPAIVREVVERRDATSQVFELADGSQLVELSAEPVFYLTGDGVWLPIDSSVVPDDAVGGGFRTAANSWTARFANIADGIRFEVGADVVTLSPVGAADVIPVVAGSTVTYVGVWPGVDVRYTVGPSGVKEDLVVTDARAGGVFRFEIAGATAMAERDGSVRLRGDGGAELFVPSPVVLDASGVVSEAALNRPGVDGGSDSTERWFSASTKEVPGRAA